VGGLIVAASPAALLPGAAAHGAAREYIIAWFISNENRSPYLDDNIRRYIKGADASHAAHWPDFEESNLKHAVSGRLACNLDGLVAQRGERVRLHFIGLGAELDMHTPQAHGYLVGVGTKAWGSNEAAVSVHPGTRSTVNFDANVGGDWMIECGVNDHWAAGMRAIISVKEPDV
jgi:FtsP/CotA-like multicopper oxidase with cupredoxin domain